MPNVNLAPDLFAKVDMITEQLSICKICNNAIINGECLDKDFTDNMRQINLDDTIKDMNNAVRAIGLKPVEDKLKSSLILIRNEIPESL